MSASVPVRGEAARTFPVSVKGVTVQAGKVLLLENERAEWELPGGKLELGEDPADCVVREIGEEAGWKVAAGPLLDCWQYHISEGRDVVVVTYGCHVISTEPPVVSHEHKRAGLFGPGCSGPRAGPTWTAAPSTAPWLTRLAGWSGCRGGGMPVERPFRVRRSCLAVPASNERFIEKAQGLPADEVFLDLEDAVAPGAKEQARANAAAAVGGDWGGRLVAVRVNDVGTQWAHRDVLAVASGDARADVIILPKVTSPDHVVWLDLLLAQVEREAGLAVGQIGIEAQIEDARGLAAVNAIAAASPRLEALVFGPADFMASVGIRSLDVGGQPEGYVGGDAYHYALMRILIAARAHGLQAIDGPYLKVRDVDGFRRSATSAAALGYDGKWVLHPDQVEAANAAFAPSEEDYSHAARIIEAYAHATGIDQRGAVMLGDEMIDEASHKMAQVIVARGRAAGFG